MFATRKVCLRYFLICERMDVTYIGMYCNAEKRIRNIRWYVLEEYILRTRNINHNLNSDTSFLRKFENYDDVNSYIIGTLKKARFYRFRSSRSDLLDLVYVSRNILYIYPKIKGDISRSKNNKWIPVQKKIRKLEVARNRLEIVSVFQSFS